MERVEFGERLLAVQAPTRCVRALHHHGHAHNARRSHRHKVAGNPLSTRASAVREHPSQYTHTVQARAGGVEVGQRGTTSGATKGCVSRQAMEYGSIEREIHVEASPEVVFEVVSSPEHISEWWTDDAMVEA